MTLVPVPLDGSAFAEAAVPIAATLADDLGAELVLTRVRRGQEMRSKPKIG